MKFLFPIHLYLPQHGAGGEMYVHNMAKHLISKGHQVRVLLKQAETYGITEIYTYEGVEVFPAHSSEEWHFLWADMVISHLGYGEWAMHMAHLFKRPYAFIAHNDCFDEYENIYMPLEGFYVNVIFNSWWIGKKILSRVVELQSGGPHMHIILQPLLSIEKWQDVNNKSSPFITLVNCNKNKGGEIFSEIVNKESGRKFLAVTGGYDVQFIPDSSNCRVSPNTPNMQEVYSATRVLLIPSKYESWGMVAAEAMACGIPVICTETPGLKENCQDAAIYIKDREDIDEWVAAIKKLDNPKTYQKYSTLARARAQEQASDDGMDRLENFLYEAVQRFNNRVQQPQRTD